MQSRNIAATLLLVGLIALLMLLAISVNSLQLLPGRPFNLNISTVLPPSGTPIQSENTNDAILQVVRIVLFISVVLLPLAALYAFLSPDGRKRLIGNAILGATMVAMYLLILRMFDDGESKLTTKDLVATTPQPQATGDIPFDTFTPNPPDWLVVAISLTLAAVVCAILGVVIWRIWRSRQPVRSTARDDLALQAQNALDSLQSGGELRDAILRCYQQMSRVLQEERGIQRQVDMTAREFERALLAQDLPAQAVHQLTQLFEQVRYGHARMGERDEALAVSSLNAIVEACHLASHAVVAT